jgi:monoamine oxidase
MGIVIPARGDDGLDTWIRNPDPARTMNAKGGSLDLAIVGAGVAGTYVAYRLANLHPEWSIGLFERTERIGGRLYTQPTGMDGIHVELGGMRFRSGHAHVASLVAELGLHSRPFVTAHEDNRYFLRGRMSLMSDGAAPGAYDLDPSELGLSPGELMMRAFEAVVPGATERTDSEWETIRREHRFGDRMLRDWSLTDLFRAVLSEEAARLIKDAFGYMSGIGPHNAADAIPYLLREAIPLDDQLTLVDGMDRLPRELAARFASAGGDVQLSHELVGFEERRPGGSTIFELAFDGQPPVQAKRLVLAMPQPAVDALSLGAPFLRRPDVSTLVRSTAGFEALKLYLWYDRAWWRDGGFAGHRMNTDLPPRKTFYLDTIEAADAPGPALILAAYGDGTDLDGWNGLPRGPGRPTASRAAPDPMLRQAEGYLQQMHGLESLPKSVGSAFRLWGDDPLTVGWHYWRPGVISSDVMARIAQADSAVSLYICGEGWSTAQAWIEGALESAEAVVDRLAA